MAGRAAAINSDVELASPSIDREGLVPRTPHQTSLFDHSSLGPDRRPSELEVLGEDSSPFPGKVGNKMVPPKKLPAMLSGVGHKADVIAVLEKIRVKVKKINHAIIDEDLALALTFFNIHHADFANETREQRSRAVVIRGGAGGCSTLGLLDAYQPTSSSLDRENGAGKRNPGADLTQVAEGDLEPGLALDNPGWELVKGIVEPADVFPASEELSMASMESSPLIPED